MQHAWFPSFSLSDLIRPEPKRVFVILSCLINFTKFREERLGLYEECTVQSVRLKFNSFHLIVLQEELMKTKLKLEQANHELSEKISAIKWVPLDFYFRILTISDSKEPKKSRRLKSFGRQTWHSLPICAK